MISQNLCRQQHFANKLLFSFIWKRNSSKAHRFGLSGTANARFSSEKTLFNRAKAQWHNSRHFAEISQRYVISSWLAIARPLHYHRVHIMRAFGFFLRFSNSFSPGRAVQFAVSASANVGAVVGANACESPRTSSSAPNTHSQICGSRTVKCGKCASSETFPPRRSTS